MYVIDDKLATDVLNELGEDFDITECAICGNIIIVDDSTEHPVCNEIICVAKLLGIEVKEENEPAD